MDHKTLISGAHEWAKIYREHPIRALRAILHASRGEWAKADSCLGTHGLEYVQADGTDAPELAYLNTGDTYALTLGELDGSLVWTSWEDYCESAEREHESDSGEIRCGYCGQWTECAENYRETICTSCGHKYQ